MKGAREFASLFETGQYGKLYLVSGEHARGKTFRIQVLPKGEEAIPNGSNNLCLNKNAVTVYGEIGGHSGWTEYYGWLHNGPWENDLVELVSEVRIRNESKVLERLKRLASEEETEANRVAELLKAY